MGEDLADLLDVRLAWRRVKRDMPYLTFVRLPDELEMIEVDLERWLGELDQAIRLDSYEPDRMRVVETPKKGGGIRPGGHLSLRDRVVYFAAVGACLSVIRDALEWARGSIDFAHQLTTKDDVRWIANPFTGWSNFREESLNRIDAGAQYVVIADITAYYENVDIATLIADMRSIGAPQPATRQIGKCLNQWAQVAGRGVPQGDSASDILAKLYLNSVDHNLHQMGYDHLRYVDDIRIFCQTRKEALRAVADLAELLRKRGLHLQSAKLSVYDGAFARETIEGIAPVLRTTKNRLLEQLIDQLGDDPYIDIAEADELLASNPDDAPIWVITEAFQTYFVEASSERFDKTLFRFLLKRLSSARDPSAVVHARRFLREHPEETHTVLKYLRAAGAGELVERDLVVHLEEDLVYPYQLYLVFEWLFDGDTTPGDEILSLVRRYAFDLESPWYVRAMARATLGRYGTEPDLERIEHSYDGVFDETERAMVLCALRRREQARRNEFFGRVLASSDLNRRAIELVKRG